MECCCPLPGFHNVLCPVHNPSRDTTDPTWRRWYDAFTKARREVRQHQKGL